MADVPLMNNPMTTQDDLVVGGASGAPGRLAKGTDGQILTVDPTTHHLVWADNGGAADILDLPTAETDTALVLAPDGAGGVGFRAEAGGGGSLTSVSVTLASNTALAASGGAYTDVLSLGSLAAGTWLIVGSFHVESTGGAVCHVILKLWDGTTVYSSAQTTPPSGPGYTDSMPIVAIITLGGSATIKVSGAYNNATASVLAATLIDSVIKATTLTAVKIA